ncbi:sensor histidine kinase [Halorientalis pallida]|uniref:histidine kinase n=1 Tax=Halorientalis pallida TaxID=2479928 RepID=A0A498KW79_9EURY|nr:histidine kinase N-terminal 7TM domain-containing protein [Halorientalis pallida]RXK46733.1 PAS domain-containing protein [Halorientalis pallida]
MAWQQTPHLILLFFSSVVAAGWALYGVGLLRRSERQLHLVAFVVLSLAAAEWSFVYAFQVASQSLGTKLVAYRLLHVGAVTVPPAWLLFSLAYAGFEDWITPRTVAGVAFIPSALLIAFLTNPASIALTDATLVTVGDLVLLETGNGPLYTLHLSYSYVLLSAGGYILLRTALRQHHTFRGPSALLLLGLVLPFLVNVLEVAGLYPPDGVGINYTPALLAFSAFTFGIAVFRYRLLDLKPIARETTFDSMDEGVVVLDDRERVVDLNPASREILALDGYVVGRPVSAVVPRYEEISDTETAHTTLTVDRGGTRTFVEMRRSPIVTDDSLGWIVILHDVTAREEHVQKIERQNDHLDTFASVVAHDLRNPLNVISMRADLARETGEESHYDAIGNAVTRMDELLKGLLTLSRQGDTIAALEPVEIDGVAADAWSVVETDAATLTVDTKMRIAGDAGSLNQVFENLFRNAIDHVGPDVAVSVSAVDDGAGFAIEDDGPGIPEEARAEVFEYGHSTGGDGIGIGLNIVQQIVDAHDWTIHVTEGTEGGARFEILGVDLVS